MYKGQVIGTKISKKIKKMMGSKAKGIKKAAWKKGFKIYHG